jgi:hypothetical protein
MWNPRPRDTSLYYRSGLPCQSVTGTLPAADSSQAHKGRFFVHTAIVAGLPPGWIREPVMPAQAGIQAFRLERSALFWIPAFAGMTPRLFTRSKTCP